MKYDYTNTNVPPEKQNLNNGGPTTVQNALGSIQIGSNGGYLVAVYSGASSSASQSSGSSSSGTYCRTITGDIGDTGNAGIAGPGASQLTNIYIFSTK